MFLYANDVVSFAYSFSSYKNKIYIYLFNLISKCIILNRARIFFS